MANKDHLEILREGVDAWNSWRDENLEIRPDLTDAALTGAVLANADLTGTDLTSATLTGSNLMQANLTGATLQGAVHTGANLTQADLTQANLEGAVLTGAKLIGACVLDANLKQTHLNGTDFTDAMLSFTDLSYAEFSRTYICRTDLDSIKFSSDHPSMYDRSDSIQISRRDRLLNWSKLQNIGRLPVFGVSWSAFIISLLVINTVEFLNSSALSKVALIEGIRYPIPLPRRMMLILLDSILLVTGSTIYRLACPSRIQEFSEAAWVEEHGYPRLQYLAENLRRRWQWATAVCTGLGGLLALYLVGERLVWALWYVVQYLTSY